MSESGASRDARHRSANGARWAEGCVWEADDRAMYAAREAKACCDYAREVAQRGQARLKEADLARRELQVDVDRETEEARRDAEAATRKAHTRIEEATEKLAEARRLVAEARSPGGARTEEQGCSSWQLTRRTMEANDSRGRHASSAQPAGCPERKLSEGRLDYRTRTELVVLAAARGIKKPTNLTKSQLAEAVANASRNHRHPSTKAS